MVEISKPKPDGEPLDPWLPTVKNHDRFDRPGEEDLDPGQVDSSNPTEAPTVRQEGEA